jgi:glycerate kinase
MVRQLDAALVHLAKVIERDFGKSVANIPGAGAAGGTGAGLIAFMDAQLMPGAALVVEASGFDQKLPGADLVLTGEGRADSQTAYGKAPGEVARRAKAARIPVLLISGTKGPGWEALSALGVSSIATLDEEGENLQQLMLDAAEMLTRATVRACRERGW